MPTISELQMLQSLPLSVKVAKTKQRIHEWVNRYGVDGVYVAFSGGKDSTVLLHIARELYPGIRAVFSDTGLEYPEIRSFVKTFDNVEILKPEMNFKDIIRFYGLPIISKETSNRIYYERRRFKEKFIADGNTAHLINPSDIEKDDALLAKLGLTKETFRWSIRCDSTLLEKIALDGIKPTEYLGDLQLGRSNDKYAFLIDAPFDVGAKCCDIMKKRPSHTYARKTGRKLMTGVMASESRLREQAWLRHGCNSFDSTTPVSTPIAFWTEQDILTYIRKNNIKIASVYGDVIEDRSATVVDWNDSLPPLTTTGCLRSGCVFCLYGIHLEKSPNRLEKLKNTHPQIYDYIMRPEEDGGLGYKWKIDWINEHGNLNIKY